MTTPERETPEQIVEKVMREAGMPWMAETPGDIVAALRAHGLLVGDPQEPSAHVNPVAMSGERAKNYADSLQVGPSLS